MKILVLFAHPAFQKSTVNRALTDGIKKIENVTFHDLYEEYPDMDIDIDREQQLLAEHDCIVFMHPMYWYSAPAIFKEWQDLVLEHGWAYGSQGNALKDKIFFSTVSTGAPFEAFKPEGIHNHTIVELLAPFTQTAKLCKMQPIPPFITHSGHVLKGEELLEYQYYLKKVMMHLSSDKLNLKEVSKYEYLNDYIKEV